MKIHFLSACCFSAGFMCLDVLPTSAGEKLDLERIIPVPATEQIPTMDFFRPPAIQEPKLNRSGTHMAAIVTLSEDRHQLLVTEIGSKNPEMLGGKGDKDIYSVHWLGDRRVIFEIASRKLYGLGLLAADVGTINEAYPLLQYYGTRVVAIPHDNPLEPLVWNRSDIKTGKDLGCAVINTAIRTGSFLDLTSVNSNHQWTDARDNNDKHIIRTYPVVPGEGIGAGYIADKEGNLEFATTSKDGVSSLWRLEGDRWFRCPVDLDEIGIISCGEKPGQLLVRGPRQEGKPSALQLMDGATGELGEVILQDDAYDFYGSGLSSGVVYRDPKTRSVIGAVFEQRGPQTVWFAEIYRKLQKALDDLFPGLVVRIVSMNDAQTRFIVATYSDKQPAIYNWVDLEKRTRGLIQNSCPWIDPLRMQSQNMIKFKTRDGHQLDAYVTLPAGVSKKNPAPLVVLPHGGPWARDGWGYDPEAQFLASRGYIVLKPNYRGSNGYCWMFPESDRYEFRKMHDDVTDAAKSMVASGLVEKGKVAIMGSSFGGYLAISGVVNEPDLYCCAVTVVGVFDWERLVKDRKYDQYNTPEYGFLFRRLGDPQKYPERYEAISPGRHVERIKVPVFVAAGEEDARVDIDQANSLISALRKYDVVHETMVESWEGHGMAHLDNKVVLYNRIVTFLDKHMKQPKAVQPTN